MICIWPVSIHRGVFDKIWLWDDEISLGIFFVCVCVGGCVFVCVCNFNIDCNTCIAHSSSFGSKFLFMELKQILTFDYSWGSCTLWKSISAESKTLVLRTLKLSSYIVLWNQMVSAICKKPSTCVFEAFGETFPFVKYFKGRVFGPLLDLTRKTQYVLVWKQITVLLSILLATVACVGGPALVLQ